MLRFFKELITFTKGERQGILVLLLLIALLLIANLIMPFLISHKTTDFSEFVREIEAFEQQIHSDSSEPKHAANTLTRHKKRIYEKKDKQEKTAIQPYKSENSNDYHHKKDSKVKKIYIDLNTADTAQLMQLRGIGPTFARRIVKYRDMLGGYYTKEQLLEVYGFDSMRYEMVKDEVYVNDSAIIKINLNKATVKELAQHVYIDWKLANAIAKYRFKKPFESIDELREVYLVNDTLFRKIAPYFTIENNGSTH
jgi:DNA uptake protein ComE-like DNA-binding protein